MNTAHEHSTIRVKVTVKDKDAQLITQLEREKEAWHEVEEEMRMIVATYSNQGYNVWWEAVDGTGRTAQGGATFCATCGYFCDGRYGNSLFVCEVCSRTFCFEHFYSVIWRVCPDHRTVRDRDMAESDTFLKGESNEVR